nr:precorrin-3B C(17)-methyltransferase [Halomicronema hongdechloris]
MSPGEGLPQGQWHPRVLWVGVGCERGTAQALIAQAIEQICGHYGLAVDAIAGLASLELKADEPGLVALCQDHHWPLQLFSSAHLSTIQVPHPSAVVAQAVGTPSVAEAAALAAAQASSAQATTPPLLVPKQVRRQPGVSGAVTLAIAQASREYTGREGHLALVGTGPGSLDQLTPAAKGAITRADVVIGYGLYVDLIRPLLRPGQIVEALPISQERQRARRAIELARWGLSVAVVSSGDCGIYGMAGLVLEHLALSDWDGQTPAVAVYPGITALQAAAARVGAPLMHDFCAISLSDLLTPLAVIEQRLTAAATADFVVALYNPQSQRRTEPLALAHRIFLAHRPGNTPVAIVRAAYRPQETVICTTLDQLLGHPIDMVTVVLIGNRTSRLHQGWMITPRGYL